MKKNYAYMNYLRFFSFGGIIFYHIAIQLILSEIRTDSEIIGLYLRPNFHIATVAVDLFFMLSGAGLCLSSLRKKEFRPGQFYLTRFKRILIPYYLVFAGYALCKLILGGDGVFEPGIPHWRFIFTVFGLDQYMTSAGIECFTLGIGEWFLGCLIIMYMLYPLLLQCMKRAPRLTIFVFTVYYMVMVWLNPAVLPPMHTNFFFKIYHFMLGMFMAVIMTEREKEEESSEAPDPIEHDAQVMVLLCVSAVFLFTQNVLPGLDEPKATVFSVVLFVLFMMLEERLAKPVRVNAFLKLFSAYSYEIFLVHHIVIFQVMRLFFGRRWPLPALLLIILLELVLMVAGGVAVKKVCGILMRRLSNGKKL